MAVAAMLIHREITITIAQLTDRSKERMAAKQSGNAGDLREPSALANRLLKWSCPTRSSLACIRHLFQNMHQLQYVTARGLAFVESWISDLQRSHYLEPPVIPRRRGSMNPCLGADGLYGVLCTATTNSQIHFRVSVLLSADRWRSTRRCRPTWSARSRSSDGTHRCSDTSARRRSSTRYTTAKAMPAIATNWTSWTILWYLVPFWATAIKCTDRICPTFFNFFSISNVLS